MVQTVSPLLIGSILFIKVPTLPEGWGPLTLCKQIPSRSKKDELEFFEIPTWTLPSVNLEIAVNAACNSSFFDSRVKL